MARQTGAQCMAQGTCEPHFGKNGCFRGMQVATAVAQVASMAAHHRACPWHMWLSMAVPSCVSLAAHCACPWHMWLPMAVSLAAQCACPWHMWLPMAVSLAAQCACPWHMWLAMAVSLAALVRVRGSCGRPSSCMSLAAHRACPWHKWQPMAVPTCMSVAHVAAHGRALVSVFGTAHGRANVHVRGKPLCMPVAQVAAHRRALARVLGSPTFNSVAQVAAHGRPWSPITMPLPRACPCHKWLPIVHVRGANGLGQCTRHTPCANAMP